jgi:hypothetical protein
MQGGAAGRNAVDPSKAIFFTLVALALLGLSFAVGLQAGAERNGVYRFVTETTSTISQSLRLTASEAPTLMGIRPSWFVQPSRYDGDGVTVNDPVNDPGDLILLAGFFDYTNELRLIRRDGTVVARWPISYSKLFPNAHEFFPDVDPELLPNAAAPQTDWNIDTHGALALPDGSVVFNFERAGLAKLDRCGRVVWTVRRRTHHSVERAEGGGFLVPGRRTILEGPSPFPPFEPPFEEDTILRIADDGRVLWERSVPRLLYDSGFEPVITSTNRGLGPGMRWHQEIVHLNKVDELTSDMARDFPMFEGGDLALSFRGLNMIMVIDGDVTRVKWWRMGPWIRQHDPEFKRGGTIVVFNNNIYSGWVFDTDDLTTPVSTPRVSNIVEVNPVSGETSILFGGRPGVELLTVTRGKVDVTPRGGLLITEQEGGRVIETDADQRVVWEYLNRYDASSVAEINEARLYPSDYFIVRDWRCDYGGD